MLYPPDQWPDMYLFPRLHPASRMSQIDWEALASDDDTLRTGAEARFPGVANLTKQEIVIYPGEILYIPPYWYVSLGVLRVAVDESGVFFEMFTLYVWINASVSVQ